MRIVNGPAAESPTPTNFAVLGFTGADVGLAATISDGCATGGLVLGIRTLERGTVSDAIRQEKEDSRGGEQSPEFYKRLGETLGVDAFVTGSVSTAGARTTLTARLVSATSGEVVRIATLEVQAMNQGAAAPTAVEAGERVCTAAITGQE